MCIIRVIVNEINNGRPVIISTSDYVINEKVNINGTIYNKPRYYNKNGHVLVAYGYQKTSDNEILLRCHTGWKDPSNLNTNLNDVIVKIMDKNDIKGYSIILTNYSHKHSGNYIYGGSGICPCYSTLPNNFVETSIMSWKDKEIEVIVENVYYVENKSNENEEN